MGRLIVLDANVVIGFLDETNAHYSRSVELLGEYEYEPWVMHEITIAEVLAGPAKTGKAAAEKVWLAIQELGIIPAQSWESQSNERQSRISPLAVATLRAQTGLPIPDCLVVLTSGDPVAGNQIMTFDERLATKAGELGYAILC